MIEGFDKNGYAYPPKVLKKQLEQVIEMAGGKSPGKPICDDVTMM